MEGVPNLTVTPTVTPRKRAKEDGDHPGQTNPISDGFAKRPTRDNPYTLARISATDPAMLSFSAPATLVREPQPIPEVIVVSFVQQQESDIPERYQDLGEIGRGTNPRISLTRR